MPAIYNARFPNRIAPERLRAAPPKTPPPRPPVVTRPPPEPRALRPYVSPLRPRQPIQALMNNRASLERLLNIVAEQSEIAAGDIAGPRRLKEISRARRLFWFVAKREISRVSLTELGRFLRKDHTSVMQALKDVEAGLAAGDPSWTDLLEKIDAALPAAEPPP